MSTKTFTKDRAEELGLKSQLRVASLFTGIAGIEYGMHLAGHTTEFMCEIDEGAREVLKFRFPNVPLKSDIRKVRSLPAVDIITAGFPCNDLSSVGPTIGIRGQQSRLIAEVFRLIGRRKSNPRWILLENVPFMLRLHRGAAIRYIIKALDKAGFFWAYRIIDTRAFGLPQRRMRVILLASRIEDPREVLLIDDAGEPISCYNGKVAYGFYWTEGNRGLGWAVNAIPTLKGGSSIGIPSPPAIWTPEGQFILPDIRDGERLQGFPTNWTLPASTQGKLRKGFRWRLVGNAVSVPVAKWIGKRLISPKVYLPTTDVCLGPPSKLTDWPDAAWGHDGRVYQSNASAWPVRYKYRDLAEFLHFPGTPLPERATAGFLSRVTASNLRCEDAFLQALETHLAKYRS